MSIANQEQLLTVEQAAGRLQVSTKTIRRRIRDGSLKAHSIGRLWRIRPEELEAFIVASGKTLYADVP